MSTKSTLAIGKTFHFYHDLVNKDCVYLEMEGVEFQAGYNYVRVPIPVHIWEVIRKLSAVDFTLADTEDWKIEEMVAQAVDERIAAFKAGKYFEAVVSCYGGPDLSREEQVEKGLKYYAKRKKHLLEICAAIEKLEAENSR